MVEFRLIENDSNSESNYFEASEESSHFQQPIMVFEKKFHDEGRQVVSALDEPSSEGSKRNPIESSGVSIEYKKSNLSLI